MWIYDLRHTCATLLLALGFSPRCWLPHNAAFNRRRFL
jgi:hypothetical protein